MPLYKHLEQSSEDKIVTYDKAKTFSQGIAFQASACAAVNVISEDNPYNLLLHRPPGLPLASLNLKWRKNAKNSAHTRYPNWCHKK